MNWHDTSQLQQERFKEQGESVGQTFPESLSLSVTAFSKIQSWYPGMQMALVLEKVQMTPYLFSCVVCLELSADIQTCILKIEQ